jgi:hypothetical protein
MPPRRRQPVPALAADEYIHSNNLSKEEYALFTWTDALDPVYTELEYFKNPNDRIKRRLNALDMNEFQQSVAIKLLSNYEVSDIDTMDINDVSFESLKAGDYQSGRSHSDKQVSDRIRALTNMLPSLAPYKNNDDLSWIIRKHRVVFCELLEDVLNNDESKSKIESYLYAIMRVMKAALDSERHILYAKYNALYIIIRDDIRTDEGNNKLNKAELKKGGLIDWNVVLKKQRELKKAFDEIGNKNTRAAYNKSRSHAIISLLLDPAIEG